MPEKPDPNWPKHVYAKTELKDGSTDVISQVVANQDALDELASKTGKSWFESPGEAERGKVDPPKVTPDTVAAQANEIERLSAENAALRSENAQLKLAAIQQSNFAQSAKDAGSDARVPRKPQA